MQILAQSPKKNAEKVWWHRKLIIISFNYYLNKMLKSSKSKTVPAEHKKKAGEKTKKTNKLVFYAVWSKPRGGDALRAPAWRKKCAKICAFLEEGAQHVQKSERISTRMTKLQKLHKNIKKMPPNFQKLYGFKRCIPIWKKKNKNKKMQNIVKMVKNAKKQGKSRKNASKSKKNALRKPPCPYLKLPPRQKKPLGFSTQCRTEA